MIDLWSSVLLGSVAIGLFLLSVLLLSRKSNSQATYLFSGLLFLFIAVNADNWYYTSGLWLSFPKPAGFARASVLLIGPVIYLYARSMLSPSFRLSAIHLFHALPYFGFYAMIFPYLYLSNNDYKIEFIRSGYEGRVPLNLFICGTLAAYIVHLGLYLILTKRFIRRQKAEIFGATLIVSAEDRWAWMKKFTLIFWFYLALLAGMIGWTFISGVYLPQNNITLTTAYSLIIYYLGVSLMQHEQVILPGFARKYQTLNLLPEQRRDYLAKLTILMEKENVYRDQELTLGKLAGTIGIPAGYLSHLINEEFGATFPDFVNDYRIGEIKKLLTDPSYDSLSIHGLALEVGFKSKSSFNAAFKKLTGMTPSEFKKRQASAS